MESVENKSSRREEECRVWRGGREGEQGERNGDRGEGEGDWMWAGRGEKRDGIIGQRRGVGMKAERWKGIWWKGIWVEGDMGEGERGRGKGKGRSEDGEG